MAQKIEIFPKKNYGFYAVAFSSSPCDTFEEAIKPYDLELVIEGGKVFLDGNTEDDTLEIKPGQYFVACGPYWDVLSSTELMDDFIIG